MPDTLLPSGVWAANGAGQRLESRQSLVWQNELLTERLAALEMALENTDWRLLTMQAEQEFSREGLRIITELARIFYLKNPIIQRGVDVKRLYVWGQGISIKAQDEQIQEVIDLFNDDPKNQVELTSHAARGQKEVELQTDGNLFFVFFPNPITGAVRVRSVPFGEIVDIIRNPQDAKDPWYYKRQWLEESFDPQSGYSTTTQQTAYYPDWRYNPKIKPATIGSHPVKWGSPLYHVKVGGFSDWKFGVSEIYDSIDWARAYKEFLEDWASIVRAYRRFAFQLSVPGSRASTISAAKTKLQTTLGNAGTGAETNPSPVTGATFIGGEGYNLQPVRTSGATVSAEDGRRLLLMVAASVGLPETFFGDSSVGTLATARSLDRPTELMMRDRQTFWADVLSDIYYFVLFWAVKAVRGLLRGLATIEQVPDGDVIEERLMWNEAVEDDVAVTFPPIIEHDPAVTVAAISQAATLAGQPLAGTIDLPTLTRMLLVALGQQDADEIVERLFPDGAVAEEEMPAPQTEAERIMIEAVKELRDALVVLRA